MRTWRAVGLLACFCMAFGEAALAHAADAAQIRALLSVQPGATCLTADGLVGEVEQWIYDVPIEGEIAIAVRGSNTDPRTAWLLVRRDGQTATHRVFQPGPPRCDHLQAAVGLAIALAIKATVVEELGQPLPDDPARRVSGWSVAAAPLITYRLLPGMAAGGELTIGYGFTEHVLLRLGTLITAAGELDLTQGAGTFDASMSLFSTELCARARLAGPLLGGLCVGALVGTMRATGVDVASPTSSKVPLGALANTAELELELSPHWSLSLGVSATVFLNEVTVGLEDGSGAESSGVSLQSPGLAVGLGPAYYF